MFGKKITTTVSCKHCGSTVMIVKQNVSEKGNTTGSVTTEMCRKCGKTSSYSFDIKDGVFTNLW